MLRDLADPLLVLLSQQPSQALAHVLRTRDLSLGNIAELALCQATDDSSNVRNEFRTRGRSLDGKRNATFSAGPSCNLRQPSHHAPVQVGQHFESQRSGRADRPG